MIQTHVPLLDPARLARVRGVIDTEVALLSAVRGLSRRAARAVVASRLGYAITGHHSPGGRFVATAVAKAELADWGIELEGDDALPWAVLQKSNSFKTLLRVASLAEEDAQMGLLCVLLDRSGGLVRDRVQSSLRNWYSDEPRPQPLGRVGAAR